MKKKIISLTIALSLLFAAVATPAAVLADENGENGNGENGNGGGSQGGIVESCVLEREIKYDGITYSGTVDINEGGGVGAVVCMINMVNRAAQVLFFLMMGLVAGLVTIGGFFILTGGGKEDNIAKGKKFITFAIVGVLVAAFAYAVPLLIEFLL